MFWQVCQPQTGTGINYTIEVTVAGEIDPVTGFVVDLKEMKEILEREVIGVYDPSSSQPGNSRLCFHHADYREYSCGYLEAAGRKDSAGYLAAGAGYMRLPDLFADFYGEFA